MTALARKSQSFASYPKQGRGVGETASLPPTWSPGLTATPKRLSPKYFYDRAGSELFERITELPEYYPTRCEIGILTERARRHRRADARGRGAGRVRQRLQHQDADRAATKRSRSPPMCRWIFRRNSCASRPTSLRREFPDVAMLPVAADFSKPFELPDCGA